MRLEAWRVALEDVEDDELLRAVKTFLMTDTGDFLPPVAKIRALAAPTIILDTESILHKIAKYGEYNPNIGWIYPRIDAVRERFGDAVADAYVEAGASRCFANDDKDGSSVSRDIARRTFATVLHAGARKAPNSVAHLLPSTPAAPPSLRLPSPSDL